MNEQELSTTNMSEEEINACIDKGNRALMEDEVLRSKMNQAKRELCDVEYTEDQLEEINVNRIKTLLKEHREEIEDQYAIDAIVLLEEMKKYHQAIDDNMDLLRIARQELNDLLTNIALQNDDNFISFVDETGNTFNFDVDKLNK